MGLEGFDRLVAEKGLCRWVAVVVEGFDRWEGEVILEVFDQWGALAVKVECFRQLVVTMGGFRQWVVAAVMVEGIHL